MGKIIYDLFRIKVFVHFNESFFRNHLKIDHF